MNRPLFIWIAFSTCLARVLGAMGVVSQTVIELDPDSAAARQRAALEENVRLSLWRLDSVVAPLIGRENARPAYAYRPFYPARWAYTRMYSQIDAGEVRVPSPLLTEPHRHVKMHFVVEANGRVSSPQAPTGNMRDLAESGFASHEAIVVATAQLAQLERGLDARGLGREVGLSNPIVVAGLSAQADQQQVKQQQQARPNQQRSMAQKINSRASLPVQQAMSANESIARYKTANLLASTANIDAQGQSSLLGGLGLKDPPKKTGMLKALWHNEHLLLVRRAELEGREVVQGCWLDWPAMRNDLLAAVQDLLPGATLSPVAEDARDESVRRLAALPVLLSPGGLVETAVAGFSPVQISLMVAWAFALLAALAVGGVLRGTLALSERRAAFVSAVTHEMRTPLTTFRMYTEMLAGGMITDEDKRQRYYDTLHAEADRLDHLVQNVLAYARLEKNSRGAKPQRLALGAVIERIEQRLVDRLNQQEMELVRQHEDQVNEAVVSVDPEAVGRILFNLVDNACKYADQAEDRRVHLDLSMDSGWVQVDVRDHGPGVPADLARRLFRPFEKSAERAAESAPGVGLGLALSQRLARKMGGDLRLHHPSDGPGALFRLRLPVDGSS
jgi:signal transduction histidine kinase